MQREFLLELKCIVQWMHEHFICAKKKQQPGGLLLEPVGVLDLVAGEAAARRQDLGGNLGEAWCPGLLQKLNVGLDCHITCKHI